MNYLHAIIAIAGIHILGAMSPGPDFAVVVKNSMRYTRKLSFMTVLGIASGIAIHLAYTTLGFGITMQESQTVMVVIQYVGGTYMGYLGVKNLLSTSKMQVEDNTVLTETIRKRSAFLQGFLCNLLNPKAAMFIVGSFSLSIRPDMPLWLLGVFCLEILAITFLWFGFLAYILTHPPVVKAFQKMHGIINKSMGLLLIVFAIKLIFFSKF